MILMPISGTVILLIISEHSPAPPILSIVDTVGFGSAILAASIVIISLVHSTIYSVNCSIPSFVKYLREHVNSICSTQSDILYFHNSSEPVNALHPLPYSELEFIDLLFTILLSFLLVFKLWTLLARWSQVPRILVDLLNKKETYSEHNMESITQATIDWIENWRIERRLFVVYYISYRIVLSFFCIFSLYLMLFGSDDYLWAFKVLIDTFAYTIEDRISVIFSNPFFCKVSGSVIESNTDFMVKCYLPALNSLKYGFIVLWFWISFVALFNCFDLLKTVFWFYTGGQREIIYSSCWNGEGIYADDLRFLESQERFQKYLTNDGIFIINAIAHTGSLEIAVKLTQQLYTRHSRLD